MATYCLKPSDVYTSRPEIPAGWVYDGFRPAKAGEYYLDQVWNQEKTLVAQAVVDYAYPSVIVRKVEVAPDNSQRHLFSVSVTDIYGESFPPVPKGLVRADFRFPQHGETYLPTVATLLPRILVSQWDKSRGPRIILEPAPLRANKKRRQEEQVEDWWE